MKQSYLKILNQYMRIATKNLLQYKVNFVFILIYWALSLSLLIVFWKVLFQHLPESLGDWDFYSLCILNSICYISWGIFVFFWGIHQIPQKVFRGEIDKFLSRPMPVLLGLFGEGLNFTAVYEILAGFLSLLLFTFWQQDFPNILQAFLFLVALIGGTLAVVLVHGCISLLSFWFGKISFVQSFIDDLDDFQKYPISFYPAKIQYFLIFILPIYFPGSFAAKIYLGLAIPNWHWVAFGVCLLVWSIIFMVLYKACLRKYEAHG